MEPKYYYPIATSILLAISSLLEKNYLSSNLNKVWSIIVLFLLLISYIYLSYGIYKYNKIHGKKSPGKIFISTIIIILITVLSFCTILI